MNPTRWTAFLATGLLLTAGTFARDLKTANGELFKNITVTKKDATGLQITHDDGVIFIDFQNLAAAEQKEFGYDPVAYTAARIEKAEAEKARRELAAQQAAARGKAQASATQTSTTVPIPRREVPPAQTTIEFTIDAPGFRYGLYDYYGRGFSNVTPPTQGGTAVPSPYNATGPYPYYYGPTVGPTIIRRR